MFASQLKTAQKKNLPFVVYKWPNKMDYSLIVQKNDNLIISDNLNETGFVFAPFNKQDQTILIPSNQSDSFKFPLTDNLTHSEVNRTELFQQKPSIEKSDYLKLIKKAVKQINANEYDKVVLSRRIDINIKSLNLERLFKNLMHFYPNALCYIWSHPKVGTWAGATPEKLLALDNDSFSTMALAGTQIFKENAEIVWEKKEQEEQKWVTKFISRALQKNKIPFILSKPFSLRAGHLAHICTEINGNLPQEIPLQKLIKSLHPTPAVAGLPRQKAIEFINVNEHYKREFYTGFLGIINEHHQSKLFVNLRCMQIKSENVFIYVGGGITADSIPLSEWQETEAKSKTLLQLLSY